MYMSFQALYDSEDQLYVLLNAGTTRLHGLKYVLTHAVDAEFIFCSRTAYL